MSLLQFLGGLDSKYNLSHLFLNNDLYTPKQRKIVLGWKSRLSQFLSMYCVNEVF